MSSPALALAPSPPTAAREQTRRFVLLHACRRPRLNAVATTATVAATLEVARACLKGGLWHAPAREVQQPRKTTTSKLPRCDVSGGTHSGFNAFAMAGAVWYQIYFTLLRP
mmetsp:Transcript_171580/g.545153  ORF Transcript_171580/g.545153 Transcript_171580/m.545153 type:complete len:111 (+) Transcript_171580:1452-1784(+)